MKKLLLIITVLLGCISVFAQATATNNSPKEIELFRGDTVTYEVTGGYGVKWSSSNDYIATVKNGMIVGEHIGTAILTMTSDGVSPSYFIVKVKPKYSLYDEPILDYGISRQALLRKETHHLISPVADSLDLAYDYSRENYKNMVVYHFENDSLLYVHVFIVDENHHFEGDRSPIISFLGERYNFLSSGNKPLKDEYGYTLFKGSNPFSAHTFVHFRPTREWIWVRYEKFKNAGSNIRISIKLLEEEENQWLSFIKKIASHMSGKDID